MNNGKNGIVGWLSGADGVIYASVMDFSSPDTSKGYIYALQSTTGSVLWHHDDTTTSPSGAVLANGIIYISEYSQDGMMWCMRCERKMVPCSGTTLWVRPCTIRLFLNGVTVYVGTADGSVYALRADSGAVEWHHSTA